jgi:hypothetical protein
MTSKQTKSTEITDKQKEEAEKQILERQKIVDYDTREYPVEVIVSKYLDNLETDENDIFVPDYQRDLVWDDSRQSKFIESILIGLPIPFVFVADDKESGRLEIVDGSQRIRTLARFLSNELKLQELQKLTALNNFKFNDLPLSRQRRFKRQTIRMIELTNKADEETRRDLFERINTGSMELNEMEKRYGLKPGPFLDLVTESSSNETFQKLCGFPEQLKKRHEPQEFVLRFFAYYERYQIFERYVYKFIDTYLENKNQELSKMTEMELWKKKESYKKIFENMIKFTDTFFGNGFKKDSKHSKTPRIRFEALSVGIALALKENPKIKKLENLDLSWLNSEEFMNLTTSDSSNSRPKIIERIEFVKSKILESLE